MASFPPFAKNTPTMYCALSGTETHDAVVSPKSGGIFDRKLAVAYVSTSGKDPLNDEPLAADELVSIANPATNAVTPPKPASFHLIPTMLAAFQNEWDALALETFTLRKQLAATREELSLALFKYDAAVNVAARATREKEEAQHALQQVSEAFAQNNGKLQAPEAETAENGATETSLSASDKLVRARDTLFALHKLLKLSLPVTAKSSVSVTKTLEKLSVTNPNGLVFDSASKQKIITGDFGTLLLPQDKIIATKHAAVAFIQNGGQWVPFGVCDDSGVFLGSGEQCEFALKNVVQILAHPSEPYYVGYAPDGKWVFCSTDSGVLSQSDTQAPITAADFHVDGALLGLATAGKVDIVDLTLKNTVSLIAIENMSTVSRIKFALNGYWLVAAGTTDTNTSQVRIYDLRKGSLVHSFDGPEYLGEGSDVGFAIDPSCQVLVTCNKQTQKLNVHLYAKKGKKWMENVHEEACGLLSGLQIESSVDEFQLTKTVNFTGLLDNNLVHYDVALK